MKNLRYYIPLLCGIITNLIVLSLMSRDYPIVGHDYRYFILRLIDTKLHLLVNGLSIQWYTPSFGGGLPAYPNPQHVEYSILQLFSLLLDSWAAVLASTFLIAWIGFLVFERFLEKIMGFHWTSSTLGAVFFIGNGFFIEHMIVGHIGHQLFPLSAVVLYAALDERLGLFKGSSMIALVIAMMIHQTGFYVIIILGLSMLMILPLVYLYNSNIFSAKLVLGKFCFGIVLTGLLAGSKIYAVMSLMQFFPRVASDTYSVSWLQGVTSLVAQLLGVMFLVPFLLLFRQDPSELSGSLANITGGHYGIWETDIGLSPLLIILLLLSLAQLLKTARRWHIEKINISSRLVTWLILFFGVWLTMEMTFARGVLYPFIKELPVLQSLHVNVRFSAAFILPLIIVGVMQYEILSRARNSQPIFLLAMGISLLSLFSYNILPGDVYSRNFDLTRTLQTDAAIHAGERFPISRVAAIEEEEVFFARATNILYYEPLFSNYDRILGYQLKDLPIQVRPGAITDNDGVYFNMTNPASLVFPNENNLQPFERIKITEEKELRDFVERRQPDWKIPLMQTLLNWTSLITLIGTMILILLPTRLRTSSGLLL
jgi:hypothetical protein